MLLINRTGCVADAEFSLRVDLFAGCCAFLRTIKQKDMTSRLNSTSKPQRVVHPRRGLREMTRWVIPPNGKVQLVVQFQSDQVGKFNHLLGFDVVCGDKGSHVVLAGTCDFPRISTECRLVSMTLVWT